MKNKGFIAVLTALFSTLLSIGQGSAQSKFLVKAGPTFNFGISENAGNAWGGGGGIEKQLGRRWSFSATCEYLQINQVKTLTTQSDMDNYYYNRNHLSNLWSVNPEFRFYPKNNPLTSLEGFFIGLGLEFGQVTAIRYNIDRVGFTFPSAYTFRGSEYPKSFALMPHLRLGAAFPLGENFSLEFSAGLKAGGDIGSEAMGLIPIVGKVRYAF